MCDASDPCCVSSPLGKAACVAKGGVPNTDPCNILNPVASPGGCLASKKATQVVASTDGNTIGIIGIVIMSIFVVALLFGAYLYSGPSMTGGSRKFSLLKNLKSLRF